MKKGKGRETAARGSRRRIGIGILCWIVLQAGGPVAVSGAERRGDPPEGVTGAQLVTRWDDRLATIEAFLLRGRWDRGKRESRRLTKEMIEHCATFASSARPVAEMAGYRALAASGLGERDDAVWYWRLARNLHPDIVRWDLERFGAPGRFLREVDLRQPGEMPRQVAFDPRSRLRTTAPVVQTEGPLRGSVGCGGLRLEGARLPDEIVFEVVVTEDGRAIEPLLETRVRFPIYLFQMFEEIRDLRFEPARFEGRPVPVLYPVVIKSRFASG